MKSVFPLTILAIVAVMITSVMSRDMSSHRSYRGELLFCSIFKTLIVYLLYDLRLHQQKYPRSNGLQFIVYSSIYLCVERLSGGGVAAGLLVWVVSRLLSLQIINRLTLGVTGGGGGLFHLKMISPTSVSRTISFPERLCWSAPRITNRCPSHGQGYQRLMGRYWVLLLLWSFFLVIAHTF